MNIFDRKFGATFVEGLPERPGVYRYLNEAGDVVYVGKAKNLKRRLSQYRLANKTKKHRRMRAIVRSAHALVFETCQTHLDACLLEVRLIQKLRPHWNIVANYSFLYPYIGIKADGGVIHFGYTTRPDELADFSLFGAYRSREIVGEGFFSLMSLLTYLGHRCKNGRPASRRTYIYSFRQIPREISADWSSFFRGEKPQLLETLTFLLLEKPGARSKAAEVQAKLEALRELWVAETLPLAKAMAAIGYSGIYPVPQTDRDPLFIQARLVHDT